jgi:tRNA(Ile)-lysidine synthase
MIKVTHPLPKQLTVAFSGGVDSVAITDFLSRKHTVECAFFHHGTDNSERAFSFVTEFCNQRKLPLSVGYITTSPKPKKLSEEEHWRNERYTFLEQFDTVVTGHHLDDCTETYLMSCMHGTPKVIPSHRNNVVRPFLTTRKSEFIDWCLRKEIEWCQDVSNFNTDYMRNYVREHMLPHALVVNPGLHTMVKKIVERLQTI